MSHWTLLDYTIAIIVLASTIFAMTKGLVREIVSIVVLIGGFLLAAFYYQVPGAWFGTLLRSEALADLAGFLLIFIGCLMIGSLVTFFVNKFVKMASLEWVDRLLGAVFGFLRGWLVCSIIVLGLVAFPVKEDLLARSVLSPYVLAGARAAVLLVPRDLKAKFNDQYQKVIQLLNQKKNPT
jgi:membrane protein required for colicin V production